MFLIASASAHAQAYHPQTGTSLEPDTQQQFLPPPQVQIRAQQAGSVANSSAGMVGQRQTRERSAAYIEPLARVNSRISNRIQSRIRNRIDRDYDPSANAASPFEVAGEAARTAGRPRPR